MTDAISTLGTEIKTLMEEIATNDKEVFEATELRKKEHQEFVDTFSTLDTARRLIDKAANRLHKFYNPEMMKKKEDSVKEKALKDAGLSMLSQTAAPTLAVQRMEASFADSSLLQRNKLKKH